MVLIENLSALKVLLMSSNPAVMSDLNEAFSRNGLVLMVAPNFKDARQVAVEDAPDAILFDPYLESDEEKGVALLRELREHERTSSIPIVIFTDNYRPSAKEKMKELGITDYISISRTNDEDLVREIKTIVEG